MVKVSNSLDVPVKIIKVNEYVSGTLQPGQEADIPIDPETVKIDLRKP